VIFSKRSRRRDVSSVVSLAATSGDSRALFVIRNAETYFSLAVVIAASEYTWCERYARLAASILNLRCSGDCVKSKNGFKKSQVFEVPVT
jgi:hypothetical protein